MRRLRRNVETAKPRELKTLHFGGGKKDNAWQQIAPRAEKMELFATPCLKSVRTAFTHEHRNCITGEGNDTANSRMLVPTRKRLIVTTHVGSQKGIGRLSSLCLVHIQELTRNAYDNFNSRSEKHLKGLQNDSIMALLSFTKVAGNAGAISLWLVYNSNITVCEALALSEGEININKTSRSFFAAL